MPQVDDDRAGALRIQQFRGIADEVVGMINFPSGDVFATGVPLEKLRVNFRDGIVSSEESSYSASMATSIRDENMNAVRSIIIIADVEFAVEDISTDAVGLEMGAAHIFRGLEEQDIVVDLSLDAENIDPAEANIRIMASNSPEPLYLPNRRMPYTFHSKDGVTIDFSTYQDVLVRPVIGFDEVRITVENTGSNPVDLKLRSSIVDNPVDENEQTGVSDSHRFTIDAPMGYVTLQAKESTGGNSTTIDVEMEAQA